MGKIAVFLTVSACGTLSPLPFASMPLAQAQAGLFPAQRLRPTFAEQAKHPFYENARYFVRQSGYEALWQRYDGHLPTGKGIVMAQVENGVPDAAQFKNKTLHILPDTPAGAANAHQNTSGRILYGDAPYNDGKGAFDYSFSPGVMKIHAFTTDQFRKTVLKLPTYNTRGGEAPGWNGAKVDVLNISNTLGNGGEANTVRSLDALIDSTNLFACTSQPGSLQSNASVSGVLWNALVVGKCSPDFGYAEGADYENIGTTRRKKPDIASASHITRDGGASSWSTPTVASGGALLLERARATPNTQRAAANYLLKAIVLTGASKSGLFSPVYDDKGKLKSVDYEKPWLWSNTPTAPLDKLFGAGNFNIGNAYEILEAGEAAPQNGGATGWIKIENLAGGAVREQSLTLAQNAAQFCATLVWNRHLKDVEGKSFEPIVADLALELHSEGGQKIAASDDPGNNVEHLYLPAGLPIGRYVLKVISRAAFAENCGLAWRSE